MFQFLCTYVCFPLWKYNIGRIFKTTYCISTDVLRRDDRTGTVIFWITIPVTDVERCDDSTSTRVALDTAQHKTLRFMDGASLNLRK